jgi:hypothetical protein
VLAGGGICYAVLLTLTRCRFHALGDHEVLPNYHPSSAPLKKTFPAEVGSMPAQSADSNRQNFAVKTDI